MKTAVARPIYKSGNKNEINNYRPISIMPSIEKVFEEILVNRLTSFIEKYKIIDRRQYGFQKGKNINMLLGNFTNTLNVNLSKNKHSLILFLDFSKAFDTISHAKLIDALENIGVRGNCLELFKNYLQCRSFVVKIKQETSQKMDVMSEVPQGSKLGPILFLIFSNNLLKTIESSNVFAYADDTAIIVSHRDINETSYTEVHVQPTLITMQTK